MAVCLSVYAHIFRSNLHCFWNMKALSLFSNPNIYFIVYTLFNMLLIVQIKNCLNQRSVNISQYLHIILCYFLIAINTGAYDIYKGVQI